MDKNILITGGQLFNKGAQAMTFITVDELKKRYPDHEIIVMSNKDYARSEEEKKQYCFRIMRYPKTYRMILMQSGMGKLFFRLFGNATDKEFLRVLGKTQAVIDVSGYALGSNWGYKKTIIYLTVIGLARSVRAKVYLMPQSFGPFRYKGPAAFAVMRMIGSRLRYPEVIMCREKSGYELLKDKYHLKNLVQEPDLVLQNCGIDLANVYKERPPRRLPEIPAGSVAVIPNVKIMQYGQEEGLYELYRQAVGKLLTQGKSVYLIYHSAEDLKICREIKNRYFKDYDAVCVVEQELSCLEFDAVVKQFDYMIASRFHSIVHGYRNAVPAIVLGWAGKYEELLAMFSQQTFMFDVRGAIDADKLLSAIDEMNRDQEKCANMIREKLTEIQKKNVYDHLHF